MKVVNRVDPSQLDWGSFKYMVFDIPSLKSSYADRYNTLGKNICCL